MPLERRAVRGGLSAEPAAEAGHVREPLAGIRAITFDFGNTLAPVSRAGLLAVTERTALEATAALGLQDPGPFHEVWTAERERQLREDVPAFREMDMEQRATRVVARLRGMPAPGPLERWDDVAAADRAAPADVAAILDAYSRAFVEAIAPAAGAGELLATLAGRGFRLAILSNWPLATTIDRYATAAGWAPYLAGIFVSQRIGAIKPHPAIFAFAAQHLAVPPREILHVGDDWAADVVGASAAGWRVAWLRGAQVDTPLPTSSRTSGPDPDLELDRLTDLASRIADPTA
ncbi:MAG: HAD family hydrolase [Chloroflexota bacterium]|nr:MAG: HAD family hydrolase [Chloroflexota bacterium]